MGACKPGLTWAAQDGPERGLEPRRQRAASSPLGVYEVFQYGVYFDAWFIRAADLYLIYLGRTETANGARERCERHAQKAAR